MRTCGLRSFRQEKGKKWLTPCAPIGKTFRLFRRNRSSRTFYTLYWNFTLQVTWLGGRISWFGGILIVGIHGLGQCGLLCVQASVGVVVAHCWKSDLPIVFAFARRKVLFEILQSLVFFQKIQTKSSKDPGTHRRSYKLVLTEEIAKEVLM